MRANPMEGVAPEVAPGAARRWLASLALALPVALPGCDFDDLPVLTVQASERNYRVDMRDLVRDLGSYAQGIEPGFLLVPRSGVELVTNTGEPDGVVQDSYLQALDGLGVQGLFWGRERVDQPTATAETSRLTALLDTATDNSDLPVLVTDFATSQVNIDNAYQRSEDAGYTGFVAPNRLLDTVPAYPPEVPGRNNRDINTPAEAANFLQLTNPRLFSSRQALVDSLSATDYDLLVLDFFFNGVAFTDSQLQQLRSKPGGGRRLLLAYLAIGRADSERFYWQNSWFSNPPSWLEQQVAGSATEYRVRYWEPGWREILFGSTDAYLDRIIQAGFDGAYLDHLDAYEFFEQGQ